jgi:FkbM family methyltransferase
MGAGSMPLQEPVTKETVLTLFRIILRRDYGNNFAYLNQLLEDKVTNEKLIADLLDSEEFYRLKMRDMMNLADYVSRETRVSRAWVWAEVNEALLRVNLCDSYLSLRVIQNDFDSAETSFVKSTLRNGDVAVDIGANLGYYTVLFATLVGGGRVYSFEPIPFLYESLIRTIKVNRFEDRVFAFNAALSDRVGELPLIWVPGGDNWGGASFLAGREVPRNHETFNVRTGPLSSYCELTRVNLIKIDVEGAEPLVVQGCLELLSKCKPVVLSEVHVGMLRLVSGCTPDDYISLFSKIGYQAHLLTEEGQLGPVFQPTATTREVINVVFVPS